MLKDKANKMSEESTKFKTILLVPIILGLLVVGCNKTEDTPPPVSSGSQEAEEMPTASSPATTSRPVSSAEKINVTKWKMSMESNLVGKSREEVVAILGKPTEVKRQHYWAYSINVEDELTGATYRELAIMFDQFGAMNCNGVQLGMDPL